MEGFIGVAGAIHTIGISWAWPLTFMCLIWAVQKTIKGEISLRYMLEQKKENKEHGK